jgi:hypothetical protein
MSRAAPTASWLVRAQPDTSTTGRPWRPQVIRGIRTAQLRYVVVDEVFGDLAELSISRWPVVDALGRLRFPRGETAHIEVSADRMRRLLRRHRMPRKAVGRELRTGDTFGVEVRPRALTAFLKLHATAATLSVAERRRLLDPATWEWMRPPIFDVTADARETAKLSYYAALTGPLPTGADDGS